MEWGKSFLIHMTRVGCKSFRLFLDTPPGQIRVLLRGKCICVNNLSISRRAQLYTEEHPKLYNETSDYNHSTPQQFYEYIYVYTGFVGGILICSNLHALTYTLFVRIAAQNLHNKMLKRVLRAPMIFFETHPVGKNVVVVVVVVVVVNFDWMHTV